VLVFEDTDLEVLPLDEDLMVPRIRMTTYGLPDTEVLVGDRAYEYERSYPIKGHGATVPKHIREVLNEGKSPLIIERPDRFYIYLAK
jgi:hypothetical protein